jgi:hypothetical protein
MPRDTLIQIRRGTASSWTSSNNNLGSVLSAGELGYETDTGRIKIGDGSTIWNNLPYSFIRYNDIVSGSGIGLEDLTNASGQVTGVRVYNKILAGANITLTASDGSITIAGSSPVTLSSGTGIHIVKTGDDYNINVSGLTSSLINDFNSAVDARITAASIDEEQIQDILGSGNHTSTGFLRNGSGLAWTYDDAGNTLSIGVTGIPSSLINDFANAVSDQVDTTLAAGTGVILNYDNGTNTLTIHTSGYSYLGHTHTWSDVTDASATVSLNELAYLSGVSAGSASSNRAVVLDSNKDISGIGSIVTTGNITVGGDLVVNGTTTTVNSTIVDIGDNIIRVNASGYAGDQYLAGLEVNDLGLNQVVAQAVYDRMTLTWKLFGGNVYTSGDFISNSLQVTSTGLVTNLNADLLDGQDGSYYRNFANLSGLPSPILTGILTGDVTGTGNVTFTELGNGILSINATVAPNSVVLGTDTTGQYASTVSVVGTGLSATAANVDDGTSYTITSNATPDNITGTIVARDSSGDFNAGLITATGFSGNGASITNLNASNINAGTIGVSYLPTNIPVTNLTNSGVTIGSTTINLGETKTAFAGLTALSGVSTGSPLVLTYAHIDGGSP